MRVLLPLPFLILLAVATLATAQPPTGSQLPADDNTCLACHSESDLWEKDKRRLFVSKEALAEDVHFLKGVNCHDCHGGNPNSFDVPEAHSTEVEGGSKLLPFRANLDDVRKTCINCHQVEGEGLHKGVHAREASQKGADRGIPLRCLDCHGEKAHGILSVRDPRSNVYPDNQVRLCGGCHFDAMQEYKQSVHGRALTDSGLVVTAVCADCHDAHRVLPAAQKESTLYPSNVASTCAKCHRFIKERLRNSIHGTGNGPGGATEEPAPGGQIRRKPSCTDCHQGHDLSDPRSTVFRVGLLNRCGNCHIDFKKTYELSLHGQLTDLGYGPGAKCSDCHGSHDILAIKDSRSRVALGANRLQTCRKCHVGATANFANYHPHANYRDAKQQPVLHAILVSMEALIYTVFVFFGLHTVFWFVRSLIYVRRHGRPRRLRSCQTALVRFQPIHRFFHLILIITFLGLAVTGLPLRYSHQPWAHSLVRSLGGFASTSTWHHICGIVMLSFFLIHVGWVVVRALQRMRRKETRPSALLFGPDSLVPNVRDFRDFRAMVRWFFGLGPKPTFERWTYWEKFDYWAVFWGVAIIGTSGLMLWLPELACQLLPGKALNIAKIIHSEEALLATSFIFLIHFFNTHLRPERFPMDMAILTGLVTDEEMKDERPELLERIRSEGELNERTVAVPTWRVRLFFALGGFLALAIGIALLVGILRAIYKF